MQNQELFTLADHFGRQREALLLEWQRAVKRDPALNQGDALPRAELFDHIPAVLTSFELPQLDAWIIGL